MKNKKIIISLLLSMLVMFSAAACADNPDNSEVPTISAHTESKTELVQNNDTIECSYDKSSETLTITGKGDIGSEDEYLWSYVKKPTHIVVEQGITSVRGFDYSSDGNSGTERNHLNKTKTVKLADTVETIGEFAFAYCEALEEVVLSKQLTTIATDAFSCCPRLSRIDFPDGLTKIGETAFECCYALETATIPGSVEKIASRAFYSAGIKSLTLCDGVREIQTGAFRYCKELESVSLPDSLTDIGFKAFDSCENLKEITIPKAVESIDVNAFGYVEGQYNEDSDKQYKKIDGFTIKGYRGSAAEDYARDNGFTFIALD